jgi:hypothetical protein
VVQKPACVKFHRCVDTHNHRYSNRSLRGPRETFRANDYEKGLGSGFAAREHLVPVRFLPSGECRLLTRPAHCACSRCQGDGAIEGVFALGVRIPNNRRPARIPPKRVFVILGSVDEPIGARKANSTSLIESIPSPVAKSLAPELKNTRRMGKTCLPPTAAPQLAHGMLSSVSSARGRE